MSSLFNPNNRSVFSPKTALSLATLMIALALATAACQNVSHETLPLKLPGPFKAYIYGNIDSIAINHTKHLALFVIKNKDECSDSIQVECVRLVRWIDKSGEYGFTLHSYGFKDDSSSFDANFKAALVSYNSLDGLVTHTDTGTKFHIDKFVRRFDGFLAGPHKFSIHFQVHPPYDSARVDFFLGDSTKG
jgi:hypothetical protein